MQRFMLHGKIHRATVTAADLHYVGSLTLDRDLMDAADLLVGQQVDVVDVDNGQRFTTYVIEGERGSGVVCVNGAAARLVAPGDTVIVIAYAAMDDAEARAFAPHVVFVDEANRVVSVGGDPGEAPDGSGLSTSAVPRGPLVPEAVR
ncbi:aspartate 1-decarboxylase [Phycicoccus sonneratiae]|uniref:Aspartate 1-decarboxylase n=1 Tax=Phycicoccus sonneratiae TaxID=2807628 RepID=A0ABS2CJB5_9MICO|nr:aspartate 1-decarboxylase [Phycicoccus sonneraticus]MBM6399959.1 aspartate 1-decarboxylase [Phycicoccus sonneraticus]